MCADDVAVARNGILVKTITCHIFIESDKTIASGGKCNFKDTGFVENVTLHLGKSSKKNLFWFGLSVSGSIHLFWFGKVWSIFQVALRQP